MMLLAKMNAHFLFALYYVSTAALLAPPVAADHHHRDLSSTGGTCSGSSYSEACSALSILCSGNCGATNCVNNGCCAVEGVCDTSCSPPSCYTLVTQRACENLECTWTPNDKNIDPNPPDPAPSALDTCLEEAQEKEEKYSDFQRSCRCSQSGSDVTRECLQECKACQTNDFCGFYKGRVFYDESGTAVGDDVCFDTGEHLFCFSQTHLDCEMEFDGRACQSCDLIRPDGKRSSRDGYTVDCTNLDGSAGGTFVRQNGETLMATGLFEEFKVLWEIEFEELTSICPDGPGFDPTRAEFNYLSGTAATTRMQISSLLGVLLLLSFSLFP